MGRPALSNLLNGRAALSPEMALRLEGTFGADRNELLERQASADRDRRSVEDRTVAVGTYAPTFLTIKARQIAEWAAGNIQARDRLPVLLRRLIHSTGRELRHVDFPGYDNAQRHGWDGWVEAEAATPWVPEGKSGWEFGVGERPSVKAERDYQARLNTVSLVERAECTFVFVTPRNWEGKDRWARDKEAAGDWKAVRALDASDVEQWLETSISPQIWLANELGISMDGFETIERFWDLWATASEPPMTGAIFAPSIAAHVHDFRTWLETSQPERPFTVAADSREEAVAFVACLLRHPDVDSRHDDGAVVFESASTLRTLAGSSSPFMPIVYDEETERETAALYRQRHCIVVRPRNAVDREADVAVELLNHEAFEKALTDMGVNRERVDGLASESGRSPTVLRRRLSPICAIRTPPWAGDQKVARRLIPMALVGAWHVGSRADCEVLAALAGHDYDEVEKEIADLLQRNDCPVWCVGQYRGVVSKIDALFAVSTRMTAKDLDDFVVLAEYVLSEDDPALDLPMDQRWAAGLYGKLREHSDALRTGVCETLVMLSVHGNALFRDRLGIDVAASIAALVKRLLKPFTTEKLQSQDSDLPGYAEAAPGQFLELLEEDLASSKPVLPELLRPARAGVFDHPSRTDILWALERLAWNPWTFMRVVRILARLSQTKIDDNWANTPIGSLSAIFRARSPQTAASLDDRVRALEALCEDFPDVGWQLCVQQFDGFPQVVFPNARPRWRNDAARADQPVPGKDVYTFECRARDLMIFWPTPDARKLADVVERLEKMSGKDQSMVWDRIDYWSRTETNETARAMLREQIRHAVLTRRGLLRGLEADQRDKARAVWERLASRDPIRRHAWLFAAAWVEESTDVLDRRLDYQQRGERIHRLRTEAMAEIWSAGGLEGVFALLKDCDGWTVGRYTAGCVDSEMSAADILRRCLSIDADSDSRLDAFMQGFISRIDEGARSKVVSAVAEEVADERRVRLFKSAPFRDQTWRLLEGQNQVVRDRYWRDVLPEMAQFTASEANELIDGLLEAGRPRAAFRALQLDWSMVETARLKRLLMAIVNVNTEPNGQFEIEPFYLSEALDSLDGRSGVAVEEMAQLEFACIHALDRSEHGIPNIERVIAKSPRAFVQTLALFSKRSDEGQDPPQWRIDDAERRSSLASAAYRLLQRVKRVPGSDDSDGHIDTDKLRQWITEARRLCAENGRADVGDRWIGQLLSNALLDENALPDEDDVRPCRAVCEVLETIASHEVAAGFEMGVYNARGVVIRNLDEGGSPERKLAARYRAWAERLAFEYPYVERILERIANRYDSEAEHEDSEVRARMRFGH